MLSCSSNRDVVNGQLFQKRKHMKGFYFAGIQHKKKVNQPLTSAIKTNKQTAEREKNIQEDYIADQFQTFETRQVDSAIIKDEALMELAISKRQILIDNLSSSRKRAKTKSYPLQRSFDEEDTEGTLKTKAIIAFFGGIIGWLLLLSSLVLLIINPVNILISLILIALALILEAFAYYFGDDTDNVIKAGAVGYSLSVYFWWVMGIILSLFLSIGLYIIL